MALKRKLLGENFRSEYWLSKYQGERFSSQLSSKKNWDTPNHSPKSSKTTQKTRIKMKIDYSKFSPTLKSNQRQKIKKVAPEVSVSWKKKLTEKSLLYPALQLDPMNFQLTAAYIYTKKTWTKPADSQAGWWFQPIWKMLVKLDHFPK